MSHDYGLTWIDQDKLFQVTQQRLSRSLGITGKDRTPLPTDPFIFAAQAKAARVPYDEIETLERTRVLNKTISDAIGTWHQSVLSLADNWQSMGTTGGVLDIRTVDGYRHPKWDKPVVAEVKNRFNTIKASDEKRVWDDIDKTARSMGAIGYLIQIVPQKPQRYDEPWSPSGRKAREHVRHCDGVTGYELVFGYAQALPELLRAFPHIIDDVLEEAGLPASIPDDDYSIVEHHMRETFGLE